MAVKTKRLYEFGRFRMDTAEEVLYSDGKPVYLKPKVFETLLVLVEQHGHVLDKETLMQRLWQDTFVEEANLSVNISQLRKALGQSEGELFIETLPRRGYRFTADVREVGMEEPTLVVKEFTSSHITIEEESDEAEDASPPFHQPDAIAAASATPPLVSSDRALLAATKSISRKKWLPPVIIAFLTISVIGATYLFTFKPVERFQKLQVSRLPSTKGIFFAAISPDGKYLTYVESQAGRDSLKLRQLATTTDAQLLPPATDRYRFLQFSPDGNYIYYSITTEAESAQADTAGLRLYKIPTLGGNPMPLLSGINERFAVSPDGRGVAFLRENNEGSALLIADDGSNETTLLTRSPSSHFDYPVWSPDGKTIAFVSWQGHRRGNFHLFSVAVDSQTETRLSSQLWPNVQGLVWLADGKSLIMTASTQGVSQQLWRITYPAGETRIISADANRYSTILSITADAKAMVSTVVNLSQSLWIVSDDDSGSAQEIKAKSNCTYPVWTADNQILFTSTASGNHEIWMMQADGINQRQLTINEATDSQPAISPDGQTIVFSSTRSGTANLWRISPDGSNPVQLTKGKSDREPGFSPDGKWLFFTSVGNEPTLWKVPIEGGEPVQLTHQYSSYPAVSPDGRWLACSWKRDKASSSLQLALLPFAGGTPTKIFDVNGNGSVRWTRDGKAILYQAMENGVSNIWKQPLDGSPATQITKFTEGAIAGFDVSPDGKKIICSRQFSDHFLALIKDSN